MAAIRGSDTKPEMIIRRALHARGFRFRLHNKSLSGRPDLTLRKHRAVVFVNGCFWHGHGCDLFKWPKTREEFWRKKISGNMERDRKTYAALGEAGWRIALVWECAVKGKRRLPLEEAMDRLVQWLQSEKEMLSISGEEA